MPKKGKGKGSQPVTSTSEKEVPGKHQPQQHVASGKGPQPGPSTSVKASDVTSQQHVAASKERAPPQAQPRSPTASDITPKPQERGATGGATLKPVKSKVKVDSKAGRKSEESICLSEKVVEKMTGLSLTKQSYQPKFTMAKRPGKGTLGRPIALVANYFMLTYKSLSIYHYDVDICEVDKFKKVGRSLMSEGMTVKESIEKKVKHVEHQQRRSIGKRKCREIISEMTRTSNLRNYSPVYDGQKNIYTCKPFPFEEKKEYKVDLTIEGKIKTYCVILKPVRKDNGTNIISLEPLKEMYAKRSTDVPQDVLMVLETIMAHREPPLTQVQTRSSFFFLQQNQTIDLGSGLEVWFGYNQSVHYTQRGPVVVINLAAKAFHKAGSVIQYANDVLQCDITRLPQLNKYQIDTLQEALKKVRVEVTHQLHRRRYNVKGISKLAAKDIAMDYQNNKITVAQYFAEKYKKLKYPQLPCLIMRTTNTTNIPFENCVIFEGQPKIGKLDPSVAATMIRHTAIAPDMRFNSISKDSQTVANFSKKPMQDFGLFMDTKLMELNGRVITAPSLSYGQQEQRPANPDNRGVWRMDGKKFYRPHIIDNWILISFASEQHFPRNRLENFASCLSQSGNKLGLRLDRYEIRICSQREKTVDVLTYAKKKANFAVVILNRRDRYHKYAEVKFIADFKLNLVTQCMEDKVVGKVTFQNDQITNNVCLKINMKLGGINHVLFQRPQVFREPCIIIGADAIHWPRGYGYPSIAAVVGSLDPFPSRYALTVRVQENVDENKISQEIILEMKDIVKDVLQKFVVATNGKPPKRIICFRDGVSEGQFSTAHEIEVGGIQKASEELFNCVIPITYIVVQKRHQTRLRPRNPRDGVGRMGNIPAGTVVDTDIVHPVYFDYFLCSHEGIQGTSKPAHYTVVHDDNYLTADELQQLSFHLCHMYGRCNRSVSLPAPVFYADLACARAKSYADLFIPDYDDDDAAKGGSEFPQKKLPDEVLKAINAMESFPNNMFYI